jgi:hypothetical protein
MRMKRDESCSQILGDLSPSVESLRRTLTRKNSVHRQCNTTKIRIKRCSWTKSGIAIPFLSNTEQDLWYNGSRVVLLPPVSMFIQERSNDKNHVVFVCPKRKGKSYDFDICRQKKYDNNMVDTLLHQEPVSNSCEHSSDWSLCVWIEK